MSDEKQKVSLKGHLDGMHFAFAKLVAELGKNGSLDAAAFAASLENNAVASRSSEPDFSRTLERLSAEIKNLGSQG